MFQFAVIENISWLVSIPILLVFFMYSRYKKKKALEQFAGSELLPYLGSEFSQPRQFVKIFLLIIAITFLVFTVMRPQGNPVEKTIKKRGRDLVFVIDVSRSMLAEDLRPNRLGKAKQLVSDVVDILEGDRVGLLVFAGATTIKCPLTSDYNYFKNVLSNISTNDVNRGGTHIGDAIRTVSERLFYDQDNKYRDIILITDGEDHDSFPVEASESAAKRGIKIHTIGIGDPDGANIPIRKSDTYSLLRYQSKTVKTKLDESTLKKIAEITSGIYVPARTDLVDLADLYQNYIAVADKREAESKESRIWSELFQFFLGISIIIIMFEALLGEKGRVT